MQTIHNEDWCYVVHNANHFIKHNGTFILSLKSGNNEYYRPCKQTIYVHFTKTTECRGKIFFVNVLFRIHFKGSIKNGTLVVF